MRVILIAVLAIAMFASIVPIVRTDCHDTYPCEEVDKYVTGWMYWSHFHIPVNWYLNPDKSGMPSLTTDIKAAADSWDNIRRSNGTRIPFRLRFKDFTTLESHTQDGKNVVSWIGLENSPHLAETSRWLIGDIGPLMDEADIGFNYYKKWKPHSSPAAGYFCLQDTAAHEWGHFAGLEHVSYRPWQTSGKGNCPAWSEYTMHLSHGPNTHGRVTLACEDKYALDQKY